MRRRTLSTLVVLAAGAATAAAVAQQLRRPASARTWTGRVAGLPYDFRRPTLGKVVREYWDPDSDAFLTPHAFGVGYGINLARIGRGLPKAVRRRPHPQR
ncbi:DUF5808 domain-containing protein [Streptomyces cynarae]|uniref:DUF5808 domain-containing protein n=1 Tax=Streptomyces cynarae TaxID=2981134 RepID=A0ABY6E7M5_9ACTN|nr:DUF5808 domain-containing protein [Streptomyces cynarae]UXY22247.1 DUF5808 domain-containing protein [Streptomyces cynarae]